MLLIEIAAALYILDQIGKAIEYWRQTKAQQPPDWTPEQEWNYVRSLNDTNATEAFFAREDKRRERQNRIAQAWLDYIRGRQ